MSAARDWYDSLDPALRKLMLEVLALSREPSDIQIEELPDIIKPEWKLDAIGIPASDQPIVRAAIAKLAAALATARPVATARKPKPKRTS